MAMARAEMGSRRVVAVKSPRTSQGSGLPVLGGIASWAVVVFWAVVLISLRWSPLALLPKDIIYRNAILLHSSLASERRGLKKKD